MITHIYGDLFTSPAQVLVNPVNLVGVMGAGIAADFKRYYPEMFLAYRDLCQQDAFQEGQLFLYRTAHKWVLNWPTKRHFRASASLELIERGLQKFAATYADQGITSISVPRLGAELGERDWESDIAPMLVGYLGNLPLTVYIHSSPDGDPSPDSVQRIRRFLRGTPDPIRFETFWRDLVYRVSRSAKHEGFDDPKLFIDARISEADGGRKRNNLRIKVNGADTLFLTEGSLRDIWHYITQAGYALPQNIPSVNGQGALLLPVLARLPYIRPMRMQAQDGELVTGVHYLSPTHRP